MAENEASQSSSIRRVVICIDGSDCAKKAFNFYLGQLHRAENEVVLLHVSDSIQVPTMHLMAGIVTAEVAINPDELNESWKKIQDVNEELEGKYKAICESSNLRYRILTIPGPHGKARTLDAKIKEFKPNFVVIGSRGLGKIRRTILGSVSDYILQHSDVPVVVCH